MNTAASAHRVAALIGERSRVEILTALMAGRALTATELADAAGITRPTASAHLSLLTDAHLVCVEKQGRHRYFRLADEDVAELLESLMSVAHRGSDALPRTGPRDLALRRARVCYDHLAGEWGVLVHDSFTRRGFLCVGETGLQLTDAGRGFVREAGIDIDALLHSRRPLCRACLDWSERRHHLAGALGAALLNRFLDRGWFRRAQNSRALGMTARGQRELGVFVNHDALLRVTSAGAGSSTS